MNKIEKAIEHINFSIKLQLSATRLMIHANGRKKLGNSYLKEMGQRIANYKLAISSLEKQLPNKPIKTDYFNEEVDSGIDYHCPKCNLIVGAYSDDMQEWVYLNNYCSDCGQKIDWEDK